MHAGAVPFISTYNSTFSFRQSTGERGRQRSTLTSHISVYLSVAPLCQERDAHSFVTQDGKRTLTVQISRVSVSVNLYLL